MTFQKFAFDYLCSGGMFEKDANAVIELAKANEVLRDSMRSRWFDDMEGYPPQFKPVFTVALKTIALKYIDEHMPLAWFRDVFAD